MKLNTILTIMALVFSVLSYYNTLPEHKTDKKLTGTSSIEKTELIGGTLTVFKNQDTIEWHDFSMSEPNNTDSVIINKGQEDEWRLSLDEWLELNKHTAEDSIKVFGNAETGQFGKSEGRPILYLIAAHLLYLGYWCFVLFVHDSGKGINGKRNTKDYPCPPKPRKDKLK